MEYPNAGSLWPNKFKKTETDPHSRGTIKVERHLLKELMAESDDPLIEIQLSGWTKDYEGTKYIKIKVSKVFKKGETQPKQSSDEDAIPF
jgi:hypothetical protein